MRDKTAIAAKKAARLVLAFVSFGASIEAGPAFAQISDPMAPPGAAVSGAETGARSSSASELQAVISGPGRRVAVIDGNVVQVGERIPGNGELLSVGPDSATVRSGEKNIRLRLHPDLKKESAR
jgi:MSHA biogenesis protein MshK